MPGLSVAYGAIGGRSDDRDERGERREERVDAALDATECFDHYDAATTLTTDDVVVGRTSYDGYPLRRVETDHGTAFLEGRLYGVDATDDDATDGSGDDLETHLERVAAMIAEDDREGLAEWVRARDGDFLLAVVDGDDVTLCNDAFARLPTYVATIDGTAICSRELSFVRAFARSRGDPLDLDRLAIGQQLAFGYVLGTRTPFADVETVPPGSLVRLHRDDRDDGDHDRRVAIDSLYEHDFDDCAHADRSVETNADELAERIETACRRRVTPGQPTVVSLSGGLDSRTVAGAYAAIGAGDVPDAADSPQVGLPASAATFQRRGWNNDDEVAAAGAVADVLGLDWTVYAIESSPAHRQTLLDAKQGTNFLGMAYVLDFFEQLRDRHGTTTYVTGDGGDKTLVGLEPAKRPTSEAELVDHAIEANGRLPLADAAAIANVDSDAIRASVAERLRSYPESDLARRYVHFLFRERGINFLGHGEDRNRYYAWSVSPFYALPVFEYAMNCPDEQKAYRGLLGRILERFDPQLLEVSYPNYGAPITSRRYCAKQFVYDALERYPGVRDRVVDLVTDDGTGATNGAIVEEIRADLGALERAGLSRTDAADVLAGAEDHSTNELELLATAARLASEVTADADAVATGARDAGTADDAAGRAVDATTGETGGSGGTTASDGQRARVER